MAITMLLRRAVRRNEETTPMVPFPLGTIPDDTRRVRTNRRRNETGIGDYALRKPLFDVRRSRSFRLRRTRLRPIPGSISRPGRSLRSFEPDSRTRIRFPRLLTPTLDREQRLPRIYNSDSSSSKNKLHGQRSVKGSHDYASGLRQSESPV